MPSKRTEKVGPFILLGLLLIGAVPAPVKAQQQEGQSVYALEAISDYGVTSWMLFPVLGRQEWVLYPLDAADSMEGAIPYFSETMAIDLVGPSQAIFYDPILAGEHETHLLKVSGSLITWHRIDFDHYQSIATRAYTQEDLKFEREWELRFFLRDQTDFETWLVCLTEPECKIDRAEDHLVTPQISENTKSDLLAYALGRGPEETFY